jgi:hypothetical protein
MAAPGVPEAAHGCHRRQVSVVVVRRVVIVDVGVLIVLTYTSGCGRYVADRSAWAPDESTLMMPATPAARPG